MHTAAKISLSVFIISLLNSKANWQSEPYRYGVTLLTGGGEALQLADHLSSSLVAFLREAFLDHNLAD